MKKIRIIFLILAVMFIMAARFDTGIGEWYALNLYPHISYGLSWLASWIPFSLEEIVVLCAAVLVIKILIRCIRKQDTFLCAVLGIAEVAAWVFVWFYLGWGCNYYRENLYSRAGIEKQEYDEEVFTRTLTEFIDSLNISFAVVMAQCPAGTVAPSNTVDPSIAETLDSVVTIADVEPLDSVMTPSNVATPTSVGVGTPVKVETLSRANVSPADRVASYEDEIKALYRMIPPSYGLAAPRSWQHPKDLLLNSLYSCVGVSGFMGPFFSEIQLNSNIPDEQLPFSYAHEYAHLLGVSNEDEANFWAYEICRRSDDPHVRFSSYFSIMPYFLINARRVLTDEQYKEVFAKVNPQIISLHKALSEYWNSMSSEFLDSIHNKIYNAFLKSNRIPSGTKNYLQVIDLILAFQNR